MTTITKTPASRMPQSFRLSPVAQKALARLAKKKGVTKTAIVEMSLREMEERQA